MDRKDIPLPSTLNMVLNGTVVASMALLAMPMTGIAAASLPLGNLKKGGRDIDAMDPDDAVEFLREEIEVEVMLVSVLPSLLPVRGKGGS